MRDRRTLIGGWRLQAGGGGLEQLEDDFKGCEPTAEFDFQVARVSLNGTASERLPHSFRVRRPSGRGTAGGGHLGAAEDTRGDRAWFHTSRDGDGSGGVDLVSRPVRMG